MSEPGKAEETVAFWPVMFAIFFGAFLAVMGISSVNVVLPVFMTEFQAGLGSVQWTLTGFMLATGVCAPIAGYLGERFSTKYLYLVSIAGYTLMSALCAVAWNIESLIFFRIIQGGFSGMILPVTMTIIYQIIPRERQAFASSMWSLSVMLAPAFGPTVSGWVVHAFSWQWAFLINLPFGVIAIVLAAKLLPHYRLNKPKLFDFPGFFMVIMCSSLLLVAFSEGNRWGWLSPETLVILIAGILILFLFIRHELRTPQPILNLRVFGSSRFTICLIIGCIISVSLFSGTYLVPVFLQNVQGATALETGLVLLPAALVMAIFMPITGKLYHRVGPVVLVSIGILLVGIGTFAMAQLHVNVSHSYIILWMVVRNIGISLSTMPTNNAAMEEISRELSGHASAVSNWIRQGFGALAIGMFTAVLSSRQMIYTLQLAEKAEASPDSIALKEIFTRSVNDVFLLAVFFTFLSLPLVWALSKRREHKLPLNHVGKRSGSAAIK